MKSAKAPWMMIAGLPFWLIGCVASGQRATPVAVPSSPGSAPGAQASKCDGAGLLLCDGFETGTLRPEIWNDGSVGDPGLRIEEGLTARGRFALHATCAKESYASVMVGHRLGLAAPRDSVFVRAFVYQKDPLPREGWYAVRLHGEGQSWKLGGITEPFGDEKSTRYFRVLTQPAHKSLNLPIVFPTKRWMCWEMEIRSKDKVFNAWFDGNPVPSMSVPDNGKGDPKKTWNFPNIERIDIGIQHPHPTVGPLEVWIDEIAVDTKRIGCDR